MNKVAEQFNNLWDIKCGVSEKRNLLEGHGFLSHNKYTVKIPWLCRPQVIVTVKCTSDCQSCQLSHICENDGDEA